MAETRTPYAIPLDSWRQLQNETWRFTLSPTLWENLDLPKPLCWIRTIFDQTEGSDIPNNRIGVYAFVLEPNIANIGLAYLLYVGRSTQHFRSRFNKYKSDQRNAHSKRTLVRNMLNAWPGRLAFYYAPIDDPNIVKEIEDQLIAAFKPPFNQTYPATVREPFRVLDKQG